MMRRLALVFLVAACGKSAQPTQPTQPTQRTGPVAVSAPAPRPLACGPPRRDPAVDPVSGVVPAWRVDLGEGTGAFAIDVVDGMVVAKVQGGRTVTLDAETGGECAELIAASGRSPAINPYTDRAKVVHGALVVGAEHALAAIDIRTGALRWSRELLAPDEQDQQVGLRDMLKVAATKTSIVVAVTAQRRDGYAYRFQELVAALDPRTGAELWRKVVLEPKSLSRVDEPRLTTDGTRVLVRTNGKLTAYNANGNTAWSTSWPPVVAMIGPPRPAEQLPLVAADAANVAIAFGDRIQIVDAPTGAPRGAAMVTGTPTELVADGGLAFAALEAMPGAASVVAIDMATARTRWTLPAAYSVQRLRVDDELVYVLDGNGRVWALDRATGAVRLGVSAGTHDFAIARSHARAPRIFVPQYALAPHVELAAFDVTTAHPRALDPFPRWEIEQIGGACHPRALAWIDGDERIVWKRELPARIRDVSFGLCDDSEITYYRRRPRFAAASLYPVLGTVVDGDTLIEADLTGVLALRIRDGAVQLDVRAVVPSEDNAFAFDDGTFQVDGLAACKGPAHHAEVFVRCGNRYVYFNGTTALVLSGTPLRVEARGTFRGAKRPHEAAAIRVGRYTLRLEGITYRD